MYTFSHTDYWSLSSLGLSGFLFRLLCHHFTYTYVLTILQILFFRYCLAETVGHKLMRAKPPARIDVDKSTQIDVRCQVFLFLYPLKFV